MDDVIVIGAGPAGSTAARLLARQGFQVRVLEQSQFPRTKPCGGAITSRALPLLPPGFSGQVRSAPTQWTFRGRKGSRTVTTASPYCYTVERRSFDLWLAEQAQEAGAAISFQQKVVSLSFDNAVYTAATQSGERFQARWLIGADGAKGVTSRLVGIPRARNGAAVETEIAVSSQHFAQWQDRVEIDVTRYPWGYAWVIPKGGALNIGVGSFKAGKLPPLKDLMAAYLHQVLPDYSAPLDILAHPLPYRTRYAPLAADHALLIGDAAGLMDSFSAEGIYSALYSAHVAAESVGLALTGDTPGALGYAGAIRERFWSQLKPAVKMSRLFYPLAGFWADWFVGHTDLLEEYLQVTQGLSSYDVLLRKTESALARQLHLRPLAR